AVRITVHRAHFANTLRECFFINVTNLSRTREIEITHVWFASTPPVHAVEADRPLPKRLKPDEPWETWVDVGRLSAIDQQTAYKLARVRLSTGAIIKSKRNEGVPTEGTVAGGPVSSPQSATMKA
ncbi:MAG TPA: hypothetical protein VFD98_09605, partial [Terracidiphilus sp.]|nr:hypothetical protein [Terracidiphilus sp.]